MTCYNDATYVAEFLLKDVFYKSTYVLRGVRYCEGLGTSIMISLVFEITKKVNPIIANCDFVTCDMDDIDNQDGELYYRLIGKSVHFNDKDVLVENSV